MQKRRDSILKATALIVVEEGVDSVTLAKVADIAGVTAPTVHNLFGKKQDIFHVMIVQVRTWMFEVISANEEAKSLQDIEDGIVRLFEQLAEQELFFKAGFMVGERCGSFRRDELAYKTATSGAVQKYQHLISTGYLKGNVHPADLAKCMNDTFRLLRGDWIRGHLSLSAFEDRFRWSLYVTLMADAVPDFGACLLERLKTVGQPTDL